MGQSVISLRIIPVFLVMWWVSYSSKWIDGLGISESTYHFGAVYIGSIFGIMTLIGMLLLTARRLTISNEKVKFSF